MIFTVIRCSDCHDGWRARGQLPRGFHWPISFSRSWAIILPSRDYRSSAAPGFPGLIFRRVFAPATFCVATGMRSMGPEGSGIETRHKRFRTEKGRWPCVRRARDYGPFRALSVPKSTRVCDLAP